MNSNKYLWQWVQGFRTRSFGELGEVFWVGGSKSQQRPWFLDTLAVMQ